MRKVSFYLNSGTSNTPSKILDNLTRASFTTYLELELVLRRTIFYCLFKSNENIMKWQANIIKKSLTNISEDYQPYVTQLFKNLLGYLGLLKSQKLPIDHMKKLLKNAFISTQEIKDEVYLHCWKQLSGHEVSTYNIGIKAWKALAIVSSCIFPSSKLLFPLLNQLLFEIKSNEDVNTMRHANYIFARLQKTHEKVRKQIPTDREISYIEKLSSIPISVYLFSGEELIIPVESYTTIKELKNAVLRKMSFNMHKSIHYGISEISIKNNKLFESFIEDDVFVCDLLSLWEKDIQESFKKRESTEFKLFLREKISFSSSDDETINFRYQQIAFDYLNGKYNVDSDKIIALASVKLSIEYPNSNDSASAFKNLNDNFKMYVPENFDDSFKDEICQRIMELYMDICNKSGLKLHFIQELSTNEFYDSYNFNVTFSIKNEQLGINLPRDMILSIKSDRLCLYDSELNLLKTYMYNKIINWGISSIYFVFVIPEEDELLTKMYLETNQSKIIHNLIETNVNLLCERPIKEIEKILASSDEKFSSLNSYKENKD